MMHKRKARLAVLVAVALAVPVATAGAGVTSQARCDFNGDGYGEAVYGDPSADHGGTIYKAGEVYIWRGTTNGVSETISEVWNQDSPGVKSAAASSEFFGWATACGDFDGDGYDDLAIGALGEQVGGVTFAGAVNVIYGSAGGLDASRDDFIHRGTKGVKGSLESGASFGKGLAVGDFDGDGYDDLAIGSPNATVGGKQYAGAVNIIYGSNSGLDPAKDDLFHQNKKGVKGTADTQDQFGWWMNTGDFNGDGNDELLIGGGYETVNGQRNAGAINVIYGSNSGLDPVKDDYWHQDKKGIKDKAEEYDWFGRTTTVGDFDNDGRDDLAIGLAGENKGGAVQVMYGTKNGLTAANDEMWDQDSPGVKGTAAQWDSFGGGVGAIDFDGDGFDDLAIGVAGEKVNGLMFAGAVNVIYGAGSGLDPVKDDLWQRDSKGVKGDAEQNSYFGNNPWVNDFDGDGYGDLWAEGSVINTCAPVVCTYANVIDGSSSGLSGAGDQFFELR